MSNQHDTDDEVTVGDARILHTNKPEYFNHSDDEVTVGDATELLRNAPEDAMDSSQIRFPSSNQRMKVPKVHGKPFESRQFDTESPSHMAKGLFVEKKACLDSGVSVDSFESSLGSVSDSLHSLKLHQETVTLGLPRKQLESGHHGKASFTHKAKEAETECLDSGLHCDSIDSSFGSVPDCVSSQTASEGKETLELQGQIKILERKCQNTMESQWRKFQQHAAALFLFARTGDIRTLLAELWSLFSIQDDDGDTPLHVAIISAKQDIAINFLTTVAQLGCKDDSINLKNNRGQTPLMLAAITGADRILKLLLAAGADPTVTDNNGNTVSHLATKYWKAGRCLAVLLENSTADLKKTLKQHNNEGLTPCHLAVLSGKVACLQQLLEIDPTVAQVAESKAGFSPLHMAVQHDSLPMAGQLVLQGEENVDSVTYAGYTPLHIATLKGNYVLVAFLISSGADPSLCAFSNGAQSAFDMAGKDEKMQGALLGTCGSSEMNAKSSSATHLSAQPSGNLYKLPHSTRHRIASVLDRNETLRRQLCHSLGLSALFETLESKESQTCSLLESYEVVGGTLEFLHSALMQIGLSSVAKEVETFVTPIPDQKNEIRDTYDSAYHSVSQRSFASTN